VSWRRRCADAEATRLAGEQLAAILRVGDVVLLEGPLGAGKTTLTQGIARGLGVHERVTSPTFTVVRPHRCSAHPTIRTLHHADVYRTESLGEIVDLALGELVEEDGVAVVEWGDLTGPLFGEDVLRVRLTVTDDDARNLEVDGALADARAAQLDRWSAS
jgi:tRNA threonylcarbamoyladenosine biosynthesis protein TsaE